MDKKVAWSFSALSVFRTCRKKFYHLKIARDVKDGDSEAAAEGKLVHDCMFKRVIKGTALPLGLKPHEKTAAAYADRIKACDDAQGEIKLCLNDRLEPVEWFAKDAWVRAVVDLLMLKGTTAILVDWKTGKRKDNFEQLKLSAALLSRYMPEIEKFVLVFEWLRDKERSSITITKDEMKGVWLELLPQVMEIEEAKKTTDFPATPSGLCGWCPVTSCPHWFDKDDR